MPSGLTMQLCKIKTKFAKKLQMLSSHSHSPCWSGIFLKSLFRFLNLQNKYLLEHAYVTERTSIEKQQAIKHRLDEHCNLFLICMYACTCTCARYQYIRSYRPLNRQAYFTHSHYTKKSRRPQQPSVPEQVHQKTGQNSKQRITFKIHRLT